MQEPAERGPDGPTPPVRRSDRPALVHPSELGLQTRSRSDRRRGTWLAFDAGAGGPGPLAFGLIIGVGADRDPAPLRHPLIPRRPPKLASLTVLDGQSDAR